MDELQEALSAAQSEETPAESTEIVDEGTDVSTGFAAADDPSNAENAEDVTPEETPLDPTTQTYTLPDGREVDFTTAMREWKDNFLPDYTKKATALRELERKGIDPYAPEITPNSPSDTAKPWEDPAWVPQTYGEIIDAAKAALRSELESESKAAEERAQATNAMIEAEVAAVRAIDPSITDADLNALFAHAAKWEMKSLVKARENMLEIKSVAKTTEQKVLENLKTRESEPIATRPGVASAPGTAVEYNPAQFRNMSPIEALQNLSK